MLLDVHAAAIDQLHNWGAWVSTERLTMDWPRQAAFARFLVNSGDSIPEHRRVASIDPDAAQRVDDALRLLAEPFPVARSVAIARYVFQVPLYRFARENQMDRRVVELEHRHAVAVVAHVLFCGSRAA